MKRFLPFVVLVVAAACGDQAAPFAPSTESASLLVASQSASAKASKVDVCHVYGKDNYRLISVNANAKQAHLDHGDKLAVEGSCSGEVIPFTLTLSLSADPSDPSFFFIGWSFVGTESPDQFLLLYCTSADYTNCGTPQEDLDSTAVATEGSYGTGYWLIVAMLDGSELGRGGITIN